MILYNKKKQWHLPDAAMHDPSKFSNTTRTLNSYWSAISSKGKCPLYSTSQNVAKWRLCVGHVQTEGFCFDAFFCKLLLFFFVRVFVVKNMVKSKKAAQKLARKSAQAGPKEVKNNPFEIHTNKRKHDILGRKLKHDRGLPGISRSKAIKKVGITYINIKQSKFLRREI